MAVKQTEETAMSQDLLSSDEIRRICGDLPDWKVAAIQATGIQSGALEEAVAWSTGDDETTPRRHLPAASPAARVYDILVADEEEPDR